MAGRSRHWRQKRTETSTLWFVTWPRLRMTTRRRWTVRVRRRYPCSVRRDQFAGRKTTMTDDAPYSLRDGYRQLLKPNTTAALGNWVGACTVAGYQSFPARAQCWTFLM